MLLRKCVSLLLICLLCVNCISVPAFADAAATTQTTDSKAEDMQTVSDESENMQLLTAGVESAQAESGDSVDALTEKSEQDSAPTETTELEGSQNGNAGTETDATESSKEPTSTPEITQTDIGTVNISAIKDQVYGGNPCKPVIQISGLDSSGSSTSKETLVNYKTTANVNYRNGAGTNYAKKGTLKTGTTVKVVNGWSKSANGYTWYKVKINGSYYYMASKYLKKA